MHFSKITFDLTHMKMFNDSLFGRNSEEDFAVYTDGVYGIIVL